MEDPSIILALARDNKSQELQLALQRGVPVMYANKMGQTALHIAALWGNQETIQVLVNNGADVNCINSRGTTPLHFAAAAKKDALAVCKLLLSLGANPNKQDLFGYLPYEQAESPKVRVLLGGPDQRLFDYAAQGKVHELRQMVECGAVKSLKVIDNMGNHCLNLAIKNKQSAVVKLLLSLDRELAVLPDMTANTPLHCACETGDSDLVRSLLQTNTDINMQNLNMSEYSTGNWVVGDDVIMPVDKSPLHLAVEAGAADIVKMLLAKGANPNLLDFNGASPLHLAVELQDEEVLEGLLLGGANPNQTNKDVTSALHATAQRGPIRLMQLLLQHRADVRMADSKGWTPLHLAARCGNAEKVQQLLNTGASINAANNQGNTPLHLAAVNGHLKVVDVLLAAAADISKTNHEGRTAVDMSKTAELKQKLHTAACQL